MAKPGDDFNNIFGAPDVPKSSKKSNNSFEALFGSGDVPRQFISADSSRIGRVSGSPDSYDESRIVEEYGNTPDFAAAKAAREAGVKVNRYPGKFFNCSKSIAPGQGEVVHVSEVPEAKRRADSKMEFMTKCTGDSCVTKSGKVRGPAVRTTDAAQGTKVTKAKVGKKKGPDNPGMHRVEQTHEGNTSSMEWHPRSGKFTFDIHPAHQGIGMEDTLHRAATGTASREGYTQPRPLRDN